MSLAAQVVYKFLLQFDTAVVRGNRETLCGGHGQGRGWSSGGHGGGDGVLLFVSLINVGEHGGQERLQHVACLLVIRAAPAEGICDVVSTERVVRRELTHEIRLVRRLGK